MVGAGPCTFAVWGYVIANCKNGTVEINPTILAAILGTTKEEIEKAIEYLSAPDPASRSKVLDGRRLVKAGAFFYDVPNHATYRGIINDDERREYFRDKKREQRERDAKAKDVTKPRERLSLTVKDKSKVSTQSEASSYADAEADPNESKTSRDEIATVDENPLFSEPGESLMISIYNAYPRPKTGEHKAEALRAMDRAVLRLIRDSEHDTEERALAYLLKRVKEYADNTDVQCKLLLDASKIPMAKSWFDQERYLDLF